MATKKHIHIIKMGIKQGDQLGKIMAHFGWTQEEMAQKLDKGQSTIQRWLNQDRFTGRVMNFLHVRLKQLRINPEFLSDDQAPMMLSEVKGKPAITDDGQYIEVLQEINELRKREVDYLKRISALNYELRTLKQNMNNNNK